MRRAALRRRALALAGLAVVVVVLVGAPGASGITGTSDVHRLPVGGSPVSQPTAGRVDSCQSSFGLGGASSKGPWFNGDGTFDLTKKPVVEGQVVWPQATMSFAVEGSKRVVTSNDLPTAATTGTFPISSSDPASQYDRNPNSIRAQQISLSLPASPKLAPKPTCTSLGPVGIMLNGVVLYNALDAGGRDAVAYEIQDSCRGHPMMAGEYHYHSLSPCLEAALDTGTGHSQLLGYAMDGFGIYGPRGEGGRVLTDADLDACHGRTDAIVWNGTRVRMYHYVMTAEYPYSIGCFRGTPVSSGRPAGGGPGGGPGGGGPPGGSGGGPPGPPPGG
ncbi:MAG TPA: YHYH protein [Acidimicrobiia bacterium]|nr:YHYH protein [Acidimicrobiia bacterium]